LVVSAATHNSVGSTCQRIEIRNRTGSIFRLERTTGSAARRGRQIGMEVERPNSIRTA